jgi:hypothetical protein
MSVWQRRLLTRANAQRSCAMPNACTIDRKLLMYDDTGWQSEFAGHHPVRFAASCSGCWLASVRVLASLAMPRWPSLP